MKTKRIILLVAVLFAFAAALTACGFLQKEHQHTWADATCTAPKTCTECGATEGEALGHAEEGLTGKPATCTEEGLTDGKKCSVCNEILLAQEVIEKLAHTPGAEATCTSNQECTVCHTELAPALGHDMVTDVAVEATCEEAGRTEGSHCSRCDYKVEPEVIPAKGHTEEVVPGTAATCTSTGLKDGKKCSVCGETLLAQEEIAALGHTEEVVPGTAATCTATGLKDGKKCSVCGETLLAQEEIAALGHTEEVVPGKAATCTSTGLKDGKKCSVCGETLLEQEEIAALGHTEEVVPGTAATCTATGLTEGKKCSVCGETLLAQEEIAALGHTEVIDAGKAADCLNAGLTEGKHCSVCNEVLVAQDNIPALGHKDENVDYKCDACGADLCTDHVAGESKEENRVEPGCLVAGSYDLVVKCSVCGHELSREKKEIPALGHTEAIDAAKAPTCEATGLTEGKHCSVCGETLLAQEEIAALGHAYSISYAWSDDNSVCTATKLCANDNSHVTTESVTVKTIVLGVSASKVTYTYSVAFANSEFAAQTKVVEGAVTLENHIATINAPAVAGRVPSHDYVKFDFHNEEATHTFTIHYSEIDLWDGTSVSSGLQGSGTAEDPYLIQSAADFVYFANQLNNAAVGTTENFKDQFIKMTKSIDLNNVLLIAGNHSGWNKYQGFGGTFDGNNCTIRGINVEPTTGTSSALFGCITKAGTLKNLIVYGNAKGAATVGGVVAYQLGAVDNVTSYVTVTATAGTIGGVVANQEGSAGVLSNCVNYGDVTTPSYIAGGVVGSGGATIKNCVNWGNVQGGSEAIGGIAGSTKDKGTISGCINYGDVKTTASDKGMIGGIAGKLVKPISDCVNYGTITGANTTGGIAGSSTKDITNCHNYGAVNATSWLIGGIVGATDANMSGCTNYGTITSTGDCVGGIAGSSKATISGCTNYGTVKGIGRSAGIAYYSNGTIENCINNGEVIGGWDLGGILAWVGDGMSATIKNCTNNGNITGTWNNGGIFGLAHDNAGTVTITGCTNNGHIKSTTGGQISIAVKAAISDCTENGSWTKAE